MGKRTRLGVRITEAKGELEEPNVYLEWANTGGIKYVEVVLLLLEQNVRARHVDCRNMTRLDTGLV